jgi:hypothetical protein
MSRYVCHFLVNLSPQDVRSPLRKILDACQLETIYELEDFMMAREIPGRVPFAKLVTVEILINVTTATQDAVSLCFVVKNEELPLNHNNHCRQMFDLLRLSLEQQDDWQPINSLQQPNSLLSTTGSELNLPPARGSSGGLVRSQQLGQN